MLFNIQRELESQYMETRRRNNLSLNVQQVITYKSSACTDTQESTFPTARHPQIFPPKKILTSKIIITRTRYYSRALQINLASTCRHVVERTRCACSQHSTPYCITRREIKEPRTRIRTCILYFTYAHMHVVQYIRRSPARIPEGGRDDASRGEPATAAAAASGRVLEPGAESRAAALAAAVEIDPLSFFLSPVRGSEDLRAD